ncbi:MAG: twin-arginine translocase subunit TatC [Anaerolineales bacterium]
MKFFKKIWHWVSAPFRWLGKTLVKPFRKAADFFREEPDEAPMSESLQMAFEEPASFLEHVGALRKHILRSFVVLILCAVVAFIYLQPLLDFISQPIHGLDQLTAVDVTEPIAVGMRVVLLAAFTAALPYIMLELFFFIGPALSRRARAIGLLSIPLIVIFFFAGMAFTFYVILPTGLPVLLNFVNVETQIRPSSYVKFTTNLMFWIGVVFEFPLLAYLLTAMRILTPRDLVKNWRIAVVVIAFLAALITPTIDPINMMLVMVPLLFLYALSILLSILAGGGKRRRNLKN